MASTPRPATSASRTPAPSGRAETWLARACAPVDIASLVFFRIALGLILLWEVFRYFANDWIASQYIDPPIHFMYLGFGWVRPWPGDGMFLHFGALGFLAVCVVVGLRYRAAMLLLWLGWTYVVLLDKAMYLNHLYLVCLICFLMIFVPAHRAGSLDCLRNPGLRTDHIPAWALWLIRGQIAIPYFFGGVAKIDGDWLHGQPLELWMSRMTSLREIVPFYGERWAALAFSYGGLLLDLFVVPLLLWRTTRRWAFAAAVTFHLLNAAMFHIGIFPWFMICATTLFLSPEWPRRLLRLSPVKPAPPSVDPHPILTPGRKRGIGLLAVWFLVQGLLPFRHFLYPGDVNWTEEGSRFAWRMMLVDKTSAMQILARNPRTGQTFAVDPRPWLTPKQLERTGQHPAMALEFSRFLASELQRKGYGDLEIRVIDLCSMNGRKPQLLIDPHVNLAAEPRTWGHESWIVPLHEPLPEKPWTVPPPQWSKYLDIPQMLKRK